MHKFMTPSSMFKINHYSKRQQPLRDSPEPKRGSENLASTERDPLPQRKPTQDLSASPSQRKINASYYTNLEERKERGQRSQPVSREPSEDGNGFINIACGFEDTMGRVQSSPQTQLHFKDTPDKGCLYGGLSLSQNNEVSQGNYYSPRFHDSNHSRRSSGGGGPGTQVFEHKRQADNMKKIAKEFGIKEALTEMSWEEAHEPASLVNHTHQAFTEASSSQLWSRQLEPQTERPTVSSILKNCGTPSSMVESTSTEAGYVSKKGGIPPLKKRLMDARSEDSVQNKMKELSSRGLAKFGSPHLMKRETALQRYKKKQEKQVEAWKTASASQMDYTHILRKFEDKEAEKDAKSPLAKALKKKGAYSHNNLPIGPKRATHHKKYGSRGEKKPDVMRRQCSSIYPHSLHTSAHITPDKPAKVEKLKQKSVVDEAIPTIENFEEEPKNRKQIVTSPVPFSKSRNMPVPLNQSSIEVKQHALMLEQAEADAIRESVKPNISRRFSGSVKKILSPIQQQSEPPTPEESSPRVEDLPRPFTFLEVNGPKITRRESREDDDVVVVEEERRTVKLLSIEGTLEKNVVERKEERKEEAEENEEGNNNMNNYQDVRRDEEQGEREEREKLKRELKRLESQLKAMEDEKKKKEKHHSSGSNPIESMSLDLNNSNSRMDMCTPEGSHSTANVMDLGLRMEMERAQHTRTKSSNTLTQLERKEEQGNNQVMRPSEMVQHPQPLGGVSSPPASAPQPQQTLHPSLLQQQQMPQFIQNQLPSQFPYPYLSAHPQLPPPLWGVPQPAYYAYPYPPPPPQYYPGYYHVAPQVLPQPLTLAPLVQQSTVQSGFSSRNPSIAALAPKAAAQAKRPQLSLNSISNINNNTQTGGLFSPMATGSLRNVFAIGSTVDSQVQRDINSSNQLILEDFKKAEAVYQEREFQMLKSSPDIPSINSVDRGSKLTRRACMLSSASPTSSLRHKPGHESKFGLYSSQSRKLLHTARDALFSGGDSVGRSQSCARTAKHSRDSSLELMVKEVGDRRGSKQVTSGLLSPNEEDEFNMEGSLDKPAGEEMCSPIDSLMQAHSDRPRISSSGMKQKEKQESTVPQDRKISDPRTRKMWVFSDDDEPRVFSEDGDSLHAAQDNQSGQFRTTTGLIDISASSIKSRKKNTPPQQKRTAKNRRAEEKYESYLREAEGSSEERIRKAVTQKDQVSRVEEDDTLIYDNIHEMGGFESPQIFLRKDPLPHTNSSQTLREQSSGGSGVIFGGGMQVEFRCQNQSTTFGEMENARIFLGKNKQMVVTDARSGSRTSRPFSEELFSPERGESPLQEPRKESQRYTPQDEVEPQEVKEEQEKDREREIRSNQAAPSRLTHLASQNTSSVLKKSVTIDLFLTPEELKGQEREGRSRERLESIGERSNGGGGFLHQERTKSLAEVFQARKQSFIEKKEKRESQKKKEKPAQKTKEELAKLRRDMMKRKKPRQESKSVDAMSQMLSRDPSKANTAAPDLTDTNTPSAIFNGVDSEMSTLRSPGGFSVASADKRLRKEPSLEVQIRLAQGLKPKVNMKQARKKAKIQCSVLPEQRSKQDEEKKKQARKELSQKKKEYDKKLRECLKKKSKQLIELQQDLMSKCTP